MHQHHTASKSNDQRYHCERIRDMCTHRQCLLVVICDDPGIRQQYLSKSILFVYFFITNHSLMTRASELAVGQLYAYNLANTGTVLTNELRRLSNRRTRGTHH